MTKTPKYAPKFAFHDADIMVYGAAFSQERKMYFFEVDGEIVSELFRYKKDALLYLNGGEDDFGDIPPRTDITIEDLRHETKLGTKEGALKQADKIIADYKALAGKSIIRHKFLLTSSKAKKIKVFAETEKMYQHNRQGMKKPHFYNVVREYFESHPEFMIAPDGFEADNLLVALTEKKGKDGVCLSGDKDQAQIEDGWFIHVAKNIKNTPDPVWCTSLGELHVEVTTKAKKINKKVKGHGFKWLSLQAIAGDASDGYSGGELVGQMKAYGLLHDAKSKKEIIQRILKFYKERFTFPFKYKSWDGVEKSLTIKELVNQHYSFAYMERSSTDTFNLEEYL